MTLVIHAGAGTLFKGRIPKAKELANKEALKKALEAGYKVLKASGSSLEAVSAAVCFLENFEGFNAGKGSVFTHQGNHEMDAAIMCGKTLNAGAVAGVSGVKNPILLAREVLEHSDHVMLSGSGAEEFARKQGSIFESKDYFHTDYRYQQLLKIRDSELTLLDHAEPDSEQSLGTVGAVALDLAGNLAAATSTGGMTNKRYGRIGDSPLIGAGTYADNRFGAVSTTGHGEYFMRAVTAYDLIAARKHTGCDLTQATQSAMAELETLGGGGGLIALDAQGHFVMPFNTTRMYRGYIRMNGECEVSVY